MKMADIPTEEDERVKRLATRLGPDGDEWFDEHWISPQKDKGVKKHDRAFRTGWSVVKGWRLPSSDDWAQMDRRRKEGPTVHATKNRCDNCAESTRNGGERFEGEWLCKPCVQWKKTGVNPND
jgi:hypothetical protein